MTHLPKKLRVDSFSAYLASDTDLPFEVWLRERDELAKARVSKPEPAPGGWAVSVLVAIVLATMLLTLCVVITALVKGHL